MADMPLELPLGQSVFLSGFAVRPVEFLIGVNMIRYFLFFLALACPNFSFAQSFEEAIDFINLYGDEYYKFVPIGNSNKCSMQYYSYGETRDGGKVTRIVHLGRLSYPGLLYAPNKVVTYKDTDKTEAAELYFDGKFRGYEKFMAFYVSDVDMLPRVAKAFDFLIEKCGGKKINVDLFK